MTITCLRDALHADLGPTAPVAVPLGVPVAEVACAGTEREDQVETGIWECSPGRWRRQVVDQEFCHFIAGRGSFTPDGGTPLPFAAGDAFLLPAHCAGVWDIVERVRKTYVLIKR